MKNTAPTTLGEIQAASQSTSINAQLINYTPLVISWNDKNKQLTLLLLSKCKLALYQKKYVKGSVNSVRYFRKTRRDAYSGLDLSIMSSKSPIQLVRQSF
jgi:hypothetical protein